MLILLLFQKMTVKNDIYANQTKWVLSKSFTDNQAQNVQTHSKKENMSLETNFPQFLHFYSEKMWFISHEILKSDGKMVNVVENAECFQGLGHTFKGKIGEQLAAPSPAFYDAQKER